MNRILLLLIVFLFIGSAKINAQKYGAAGGLHADRHTVGIQYKHRILETHTIDGLLAFSSTERYVKGTYNIHKRIFTKSFNYFLGAGGHIGSIDVAADASGLFLGLDAVVGLEFKFPALPVVAAVDFNPTLHLNRSDNIQLLTGISLLYILQSERDVRKKNRSKKRAIRRS